MPSSVGKFAAMQNLVDYFGVELGQSAIIFASRKSYQSQMHNKTHADK